MFNRRPIPRSQHSLGCWAYTVYAEEARLTVNRGTRRDRQQYFLAYNVETRYRRRPWGGDDVEVRISPRLASRAARVSQARARGGENLSRLPPVVFTR